MRTRHARMPSDSIFAVGCFFLVLFFFIAGCTGAGDDSASDDDGINPGNDDSDDSHQADDDGVDDDQTDDDAVDDDTTPSLDDDTSDDDDTVVDDDLDDDEHHDWPPYLIDLCEDEDGDGYGAFCPAGPDCDDSDPYLYQLVFLYPDADNDGIGVGALVEVCAGDAPPPGYAEVNNDCNDADPSVNPAAPELPDDGIDQNCDTQDLIMSDAAGVFVAPSGNNENDGSMASPKRTVQAAVTTAEASGKAVFIAEGEYLEDVVTSASLFGGYEATGWSRDIPNHPTVISAVHQEGVRTNEGSAVAIQGIEIHGGDTVSNSIGLALGDNSRGTIKECNVDGGTASQGTTGVWIQNNSVAVLSDNRIYGGSPSGPEHTTSGLSTGEYVRLTMDHNHITTAGGGTTQGAVAMGMGESSYGHLTSNTILGPTGGKFTTGLYFGFHVIAVLENNLIDGGSGGAESSNALIMEGNGNLYLEDNQIFGGAPAGNNGDSVGVDLYGDTKAELLNNVIDGGSGQRTATAVSAESYFRRANDFNQAPGQGHLPQKGFGTMVVTLVNNIIRGGSSLYTTGVQAHYGDLLAINNFVQGGTGTSMVQGFLLETESTLINNIIYDGSANNSAVVTIGANWPMILINNDLWGAEGGCLIFTYDACINELSQINDCEWAHCSEAAGNITADPEFTNPSGGDFHVNVGSPCIDAGTDPAPWYDGPLADFDFEDDARPQGADWDIGVDEFTASAGRCPSAFDRSLGFNP